MSKDEIKFAIKALEECASIVDHQTIGCDAENAVANAHEAISLLKVLAEQPAQQEPVCYKHGDEPKRGCAWCDKQPAQQEPAFWTRKQWGMDREFCEKPFTTDWEPLYTSPPAQRKPLTNEEISEIAINTPPMVHEFARAIEVAHGIKENT